MKFVSDTSARATPASVIRNTFAISCFTLLMPQAGKAGAQILLLSPSSSMNHVAQRRFTQAPDRCQKVHLRSVARPDAGGTHTALAWHQAPTPWPSPRQSRQPEMDPDASRCRRSMAATKPRQVGLDTSAKRQRNRVCACINQRATPVYSAFSTVSAAKTR